MNNKFAVAAAHLLALCLLMSGLAAPSLADDFIISPAAVSSLPAGVQDSIRAQAQQFANSMQAYMGLKLDEVNRVCTLTGNQRIKLKVAAKGAIEYTIGDWVDGLSAQFGAAAQPAGAGRRGQAAVMGGQVNAVAAQPAAGRRGVAARRLVGEPVADVAVAGPAAQLNAAGAQLDAAGAQLNAAGARDAAVAQQQALELQMRNQRLQEAQLVAQLQQQQAFVQQQGGQAPRQITVIEEMVVNDNGVNRVVRQARVVPAGAPINPNSAEQQHVWTSALDNTLTPEQRKLLTDSESERTANKENATASARIVLQIDQWLLLDPSQRKKVAELVDKTVELPTFKVQLQRTPQLSPAIIDRIIKRIPAADMTAMLSPAQTTRWQQALQSQLPQNAVDGPVNFQNDQLQLLQIR